MSSTFSHYSRFALLSFMALAICLGATPQASYDHEVSFASTDEAVAPQAAAANQDVVPSIEYALDKVTQSQGWQALLGMTNNTNNRSCTDCLTPARSERYMQCTAKNDYLEKELKTLSEGSSLLGAMIRHRPRDEKAIIKPICIEMGMTQKFGQNSRNFKTCDAGGKLSTSYRPCISDNYFRIVQNSFDLVSSCMMGQISPSDTTEEQKKDVRAAYAMINIESGFHVNAMSGTGAGGIGQFTGSAITDVNNNEINDVRFKLEDSRNPLCVKMSHEMLDSMQPMRADARNSCDRISVSRGNPMKNMIYTFAYLKGVKKTMNRLVFDHKSYSQKFSKLSETDLNKIKRAVMVWAHNSGNSGVWTPVKALLNTAYRNKPVTNPEEFINQLQQYMAKFPASANKSDSRRRETSRYFPEITKTLNQIETNVGGGSCVN